MIYENPINQPVFAKKMADSDNIWSIRGKI